MQSLSSTEPILLRPIFKDYLSGGRKLAEKYGKQSDLPRMAESWELAAHKNGQSNKKLSQKRNLMLIIC